MKKLFLLVPIIALMAAGCSSQPSQNTSNPNGDSLQQQSTTPPASGTNNAQNPTTPAQTTPAPSSPKDNPTAETAIKTFTVKGSNFAYAPSEIKVKKGDKIKIIFENTGGFHDFVIDELNVKTAQIQAGKSETLEFTADKIGTFEYYCSVGSHRQMGMKGNLIVE